MMKGLVKLLILMLIPSLFGCAGTKTGNPIVSIKFAAFSAAALSKIEVQAVDSITMCFKRLRFKKDGEDTNADPTLDEDNIDLELGEVALSSIGNDLVSVSVPEGTYTRVEFDLEDKCSTGNSLSVTNSGTTYKTNSRITIKFDGSFVVSESFSSLELMIQPIVSSLGSVTADNQVKSAAEASSGSF